MPFSRRQFLLRVGAGGAGLAFAPALTARGLEASREPGPAPLRAAPGPLRLDSNENPYGPSPAALDAIQGAMGEASRYPDAPEVALREAIARQHGVTPDMVLLGSGSTEILRVAVMSFCRGGRALVTAAPTFEEPGRIARTMGAPVVDVPTDARMQLDLDAMARAAGPAGLVFCCNPNNPTATVHGEDAIRRFTAEVRRTAPECVVLLDEAYHEYVEDPGYATAIPLVRQDPRVVVCRTLSKVHGLAGIRAGYAIAQRPTIEAMQPWRLPSGISVAAGAAAMASLGGTSHIGRQQRLNREARAFTRSFFETAGYRVAPSETNFIMVDIKRDSKVFKAACLSQGISVGRQFPPYLQHARISIGTMDEMRRAVEVFRRVLGSA
jgi:histidinol-phosphate aminotransferase